MKSLVRHINEKLIVNKNFKGINTNDEFYNEFQEELNEGSYLIWDVASELKNVIPIGISEKEKKVITNAFDTKKKILYTRINNTSNNYTVHIYKKMMEFINSNDIEFIYNNYDDYKMYVTYIFKAGKRLLCIVGPKKIDKRAQPWMYTSKATFIQQEN